MPPEILPKSIATAGLFAHVLTNKFCDHIPYYRQEKIFQRYGIDISAANLSNWQIQFYERFDRLEEFFWQDLLAEKVILADETPLQVLREKDRTNTQKSWMFAFATEKIRFFQYRETRSAAFLSERFRDFRGVIASDGYKSYDALCRRLKIQHSACWAHTRRKFIELIKNSPHDDSFAHQIAHAIRKLYAFDARCRKLSLEEEILECPQESPENIVHRIFELLKKKQLTVPRSQPLGKAIRYALGQETKLRLFLKNGNVPIDTNAVENAIRPFVVGRKNWLFSGSPRGADSSALIYSLIETAKANDLEPWAYLRYLFEKLPLCQSDDEMRALLPHRVNPTDVENFDPAVR
jgi:transposase